MPTRLWGFSGHLQTIVQGFFSRVYCPLVNGKRYFFIQPDGATVTYDLYQPYEHHVLNGGAKKCSHAFAKTQLAPWKSGPVAAHEIFKAFLGPPGPACFYY